MNQTMSLFKKMKIEVGGKTIEVEAQKIGSSLWYKTGSTTGVISVEKSFSSRRKKSSLKNMNQVLAPMPGKITKVLVQVGEEVATGQTLLVMEAMKMEYTLKSPAPRKIKSILGKLGDQVQLGQVIVEFEIDLSEKKEGTERG